MEEGRAQSLTKPIWPLAGCIYPYFMCICPSLIMGVFYPSAFLCITEMPEIMRPLDHRKQESGCSLYRKVDTEQPSSPDIAWA